MAAVAAPDLGDQLLADTASEPAAAEAAIIQEDICVREPASPGVGGSSGVARAESPVVRLRSSRRRLRPRQEASPPSTPSSSPEDVQVLELCSSYSVQFFTLTDLVAS